MGLELDHRSAEQVSGPAGARRDRLFRESASERLERWALGTAWALHPKRVGNLPGLARLWASDLFGPHASLPDPDRTLNPAGLCGIVHDLSMATLIEAYRTGLFTFAHYGPLKWYSLDERCVLFFDDFHISKGVRRLLRQGRHTVTFDRDFDGVIKACAGRREGKWHVTWITPRIMRAYADLFDAGIVHSFETWNADGTLVGGGYGVAIGNVFFTESQFSRERDTSKLGFAVLNRHLAGWGFELNDGKWATPALLDVGFQVIPRTEFRRRVAAATRARGKPGRWRVEFDAAAVAAWQPQGGHDSRGEGTGPA